MQKVLLYNTLMLFKKVNIFSKTEKFTFCKKIFISFKFRNPYEMYKKERTPLIENPFFSPEINVHSLF